MDMSKDQDFKVTDKRASSGATDATSQGEGFVMKEGKEELSAPPQQIDFGTLVFSFATSALINMGLSPDPNTSKTVKNLDFAKQNIDILEVLQKKTKGNLTAEENQLMENLLAEVRLKFVEVSKKG